MKTSVIIPCYNEEENIRACGQRIQPLGVDCEYLFVDDGSTDRTRQRITELSQEIPRVRLIALDRNGGKARAVRTGIERAAGDVVVIFDADMSTPPEEIPLFLQAVAQDEKALVMGTRFAHPFDPKAMRWTNRLSNRITARLFSWFLRTRITDTLCGTKAVWRKEALRMPSGTDRWGDFDMLVGAYQQHLHIVEVPVHYQPRSSGASKMKVFPDACLLFLNCGRIGWRLLWHRVRSHA